MLPGATYIVHVYIEAAVFPENEVPNRVAALNAISVVLPRLDEPGKLGLEQITGLRSVPELGSMLGREV